MDEDPDASELIGDDEEPKWPGWSNYIRLAWNILRDDRWRGSMGGRGRIYYSSVSRYARDHGIELQPFALFLYAMDDEFIQWCNEKEKEESDKANLNSEQP